MFTWKANEQNEVTNGLTRDRQVVPTGVGLSGVKGNRAFQVKDKI